MGPLATAVLFVIAALAVITSAVIHPTVSIGLSVVFYVSLARYRKGLETDRPPRLLTAVIEPPLDPVDLRADGPSLEPGRLVVDLEDRGHAELAVGDDLVAPLEDLEDLVPLTDQGGPAGPELVLEPGLTDHLDGAGDVLADAGTGTDGVHAEEHHHLHGDPMDRGTLDPSDA